LQLNNKRESSSRKLDERKPPETEIKTSNSNIRDSTTDNLMGLIKNEISEEFLAGKFNPSLAKYKNYYIALLKACLKGLTCREKKQMRAHF